MLAGNAPFAALDRVRRELPALDEVDADFAYNAFDVKRRGWPRFETGCAGTVVAYEQQGLKAGALQKKQIELATKAPKLVNIDYAMSKGARELPDDDEDDQDNVWIKTARLRRLAGRGGEQDEGPIDFSTQLGNTKPAEYLCQIKEQVSAAKFTGKGDEVKVKALLDQFEGNVRTSLQEAQRKNWEKKYQMPPRSHQWHKAVAKDQTMGMGFGMERQMGCQSLEMQLLFAALVCETSQAAAPPRASGVVTTTAPSAPADV